MNPLRKLLPRLAPFAIVAAAMLLAGVVRHEIHAAEKPAFPGLPTATGAAVPAAVTYWLGKGRMNGSKEDAAAAVTRLNAEFAARGYRFAGLVPHVENADFQGLWITYVPGG
jgi:hypothetical protein